jgi:predicted ATP-grasp superfamily ATP-dependent carboligase
MPVLAVAAVSARMLAEAAAQDGYGVVALDLFGDADTRRASQRWHPIGAASSLQIDEACVLDALQQLAQQGGDAVIGWIPGSGFEGRPELLEAGARLLPLIGTPADAVRRVRDPAVFFGVLEAHGIAHPPVRADAPADAEGWLLKDARGTGGWHIRHAAAAGNAFVANASLYFQRAMPGMPMSATFIANGEQAMLLGINELIVRPFGARPHVYGGCIGPVALTADLAHRVSDAVRVLSAAFGLRGWCSLDFVRDGDSIGVLEVNPRPPASLSLYAQRGLVDAQLQACLQAELPSPMAFAPRRVSGNEIVYARRALTLAPLGAQHLAGRADVHDLPVAGARFAAGDPICSLSATGDTAEQVRASLGAARKALMHTLETTS